MQKQVPVSPAHWTGKMQQILRATGRQDDVDIERTDPALACNGITLIWAQTPAPLIQVLFLQGSGGVHNES